MAAVHEQLLQANRAYAEGHQGGLAAPPARRLAVITCMDARLHPERFLGLELGDAHVIRNAGGRASDDALRSLVISTRLLGTTDILVIHHSDCGMLSFTNDELRGRLAEETGADASGIDFLPFSDLEQSVRDDVESIRESPFLDRSLRVSGAVYEVESGRLREVVAPVQLGSEAAAGRG